VTKIASFADRSDVREVLVVFDRAIKVGTFVVLFAYRIENQRSGSPPVELTSSRHRKVSNSCDRKSLGMNW